MLDSSSKMELASQTLVILLLAEMVNALPLMMSTIHAIAMLDSSLKMALVENFSVQCLEMWFMETNHATEQNQSKGQTASSHATKKTTPYIQQIMANSPACKTEIGTKRNLVAQESVPNLL